MGLEDVINKLDIENKNNMSETIREIFTHYGHVKASENGDGREYTPETMACVDMALDFYYQMYIRTTTADFAVKQYYKETFDGLMSYKSKLRAAYQRNGEIPVADSNFRKQLAKNENFNQTPFFKLITRYHQEIACHTEPLRNFESDLLFHAKYLERPNELWNSTSYEYDSILLRALIEHRIRVNLQIMAGMIDIQSSDFSHYMERIIQVVMKGNHATRQEIESIMALGRVLGVADAAIANIATIGTILKNKEIIYINNTRPLKSALKRSVSASSLITQSVRFSPPQQRSRSLSRTYSSNSLLDIGINGGLTPGQALQAYPPKQNRTPSVESTGHDVNMPDETHQNMAINSRGGLTPSISDFPYTLSRVPVGEGGERSETGEGAYPPKQNSRGGLTPQAYPPSASEAKPQHGLTAQHLMPPSAQHSGASVEGANLPLQYQDQFQTLDNYCAQLKTKQNNLVLIKHIQTLRDVLIQDIIKDPTVIKQQKNGKTIIQAYCDYLVFILAPKSTINTSLSQVQAAVLNHPQYHCISERSQYAFLKCVLVGLFIGVLASAAVFGVAQLVPDIATFMQAAATDFAHVAKGYGVGFAGTSMLDVFSLATSAVVVAGFVGWGWSGMRETPLSLDIKTAEFKAIRKEARVQSTNNH